MNRSEIPLSMIWLIALNSETLYFHFDRLQPELASNI